MSLQSLVNEDPFAGGVVEVNESALSEDEVDAEILRAIACNPHRPLVSTKPNGYYCSFDKNDIYNLIGLNGRRYSSFTVGEDVSCREDFHDGLVAMLQNDFGTTQTVSVPLYSQGKRVPEGLFIYYDASDSILYGIHVRSALNQDDP